MKRPAVAGLDVVFPLLVALGVAGLGLGLQLRLFPIGDADLETDFYGDLVLAARHLAAGRFSVHDFPYKGPFYAVVLIPFRLVAGDWYRGAVILSALCGGAALFLAYRLVRSLFGRRVAVLSTISVPLVVEFFVQLHRASTDVLFTALCLASMALTILPGATRRRLAVAGAVAGLAFLTRYNGAFLPVGTFLALVIANPDRWSGRRRVLAFGLYAVCFLLVCAPWFVANWLETGRILATRNVQNITATFYGAPRWQTDPASQLESLPRLVTAHPAYFVERYFLNLIDHLQRDFAQLLQWPLSLIPLAGLLGLVLRRPTRRQSAFYLFAVAYWLLMGIVFYASRFSLPLILPYLVFGFSWVQTGDAGTTPWGRGIATWVQDPSRRRAALFLGIALTAAIVLLQVHKIMATERMLYARRPLYILDAAESLAGQNDLGSTRIIARKGHIAYYAGLDFVPYSTHVGSLEDLLRYAHREDAKYVTYSKIEYSLLPRMLFMAVTDTVPLLREIYRGPSVRVFQVPEGEPLSLSDADRHVLLLATLRAARVQNRSTSIYLACSDLASYHLQRGGFAKAAAYASDALRIAGSERDDVSMERAAAVARHNLARAELGLGSPEVASTLLQENLDYFRSSGSRRDVARTRVMLANVYATVGRDEDARRERLLAHELDPANSDPSFDPVDFPLDLE